MYKKVETNLNFVQREKEIIEFWETNKIFEQSIKKNEGGEEFCFYDGPPTANGKPHIGHVLTRVMKDIIPRYQTMKGKHALRKAGWDTHGLPVELEVEKKLGLDGKQDIEKYGIEPFIKQCKDSVFKYTTEWKIMSDRLGYWCDMDNPYVTYHDDYIESEWWALKEIWKKGLLYKGYKIVPYCPRCGTALSSHEVAQGYKDVTEKSVFVKFKVKGEENKYFLAWTTTPWTLPSNVALCFNPTAKYVEIKVESGEIYILAEDLASSLFENYQVLSTKTGKEYEYTEYLPLFDYTLAAIEQDKKAFICIVDDYVTLEDGSGIVHNAPAFGEDDSRVCKKYDIAFVNLVDTSGKMTSECGEIAGLFVKDADKVIISDLEKRNLLFAVKEFTHSYPFCWRCNTPLIYYARSSWFIKTTAVKEDLIKSNNSVNWMPETIKTGRMGNFIENVIDWGISRERYWGTPLPVWTCDKCEKVHTIGSKQELKDLCGIEGDIELHRPYIDVPTFKCECGGTMRRVKDVIDCWFDSGSMPFAQLHYPFENKDLFEKLFPADFISEAVDQTRGWFYTLLVISTILFKKSPFNNCIVLGHVNDKNGIKMSKHIGNVVDPWTVLDNQGSDAVRWYFYTGSNPWLPSRFYPEAVSESQRKFIGTLWNAYAFFVLYADIDKYNPANYDIKKCKLSLMDKWALSKLNTLIEKIDKGLDNYQIFETSRYLQEYVDDLSNWYIRRGRERYWGKEMTDDKISAYTTLYTILVTLCKLSAPYVPFISETMYNNLVPNFFKDAPISVHLCDFPTKDDSMIDSVLEKGMDEILEIVVLGRASRNASNIKNRQPLSKLYVITERKLTLNNQLLEIARDELNIKDVEILKDAENFVTYKIKPQLKTLGPKYGAKLGAIRKFLETCNASEVVKTVKNGEVYKVNLDGADIEFTIDDLLISSESMEGFVSASDNGLTVVLDVNITKELLLEGIEREVISKIQTMRKEAGFEVTDRINITYEADGNVALVLEERAEQIKKVVLCENLIKSTASVGYVKTWEIDNGKIIIGIEKC